jgi:hypothetical protein
MGEGTINCALKLLWENFGILLLEVRSGEAFIKDLGAGGRRKIVRLRRFSASSLKTVPSIARTVVHKLPTTSH